MRAAIYTEPYVAVAFQVPIAEFHTAATLHRHRSVQNLGPDVLAPDFDPAAAMSALRSRPDLEVGVALLSQQLLAGIGNVFKSEVCFASRVHPFRTVESLSIIELTALIANARKLMQANVTDTSGMRRTTGRANSEENLWVYRRRGHPCRVCGSAIQSRKQGLDARITFWCPNCQQDFGPERAYTPMNRGA
jgi:endonuclease-8